MVFYSFRILYYGFYFIFYVSLYGIFNLYFCLLVYDEVRGVVMGFFISGFISLVNVGGNFGFYKFDGGIVFRVMSFFCLVVLFCVLFRLCKMERVKIFILECVVL